MIDQLTTKLRSSKARKIAKQTLYFISNNNDPLHLAQFSHKDKVLQAIDKFNGNGQENMPN